MPLKHMTCIPSGIILSKSYHQIDGGWSMCSREWCQRCDSWDCISQTRLQSRWNTNFLQSRDPRKSVLHFPFTKIFYPWLLLQTTPKVKWLKATVIYSVHMVLSWWCGLVSGSSFAQLRLAEGQLVQNVSAGLTGPERPLLDWLVQSGLGWNGWSFVPWGFPSSSRPVQACSHGSRARFWESSVQGTHGQVQGQFHCISLLEINHRVSQMEGAEKQILPLDRRILKVTLKGMWTQGKEKDCSHFFEKNLPKAQHHFTIPPQSKCLLYFSFSCYFWKPENFPAVMTAPASPHFTSPNQFFSSSTSSGLRSSSFSTLSVNWSWIPLQV